MTAVTSAESLCDHCSNVSNLTLNGPHLDDYHKYDDFLNAESEQGEHGLKVGEVTERAPSCLLCSMVLRVLERSGVAGGEPARRTILRFLTPHGKSCDGSTPWSSRTERRPQSKHKSEVGEDEDIDVALSTRRKLYVFTAEMLLMSTSPWSPGSHRHLRSIHKGVAAIGVDVETAPSSGKYTRCCSHLEVAVDRDAPWQLRAICMRRTISSLKLQHSFDRATHCLHDCEANHWRCRRALSGDIPEDTQGLVKLPRRLICLGTATPRLVDTKGQRGRYAALSYCWGPGPHTTLKKKNVEEFYSAIPLHKLSRSIRDAVEAARHLHFELLWIDALCIIQDDDRDWTHETANMASTYEHATLVLASLNDGRAESGFLTRSTGRQIQLPWYSQDFVKLGDMTINEPAHALPLDVKILSGRQKELLLSAWTSRGWTLQERVLARRIVYFGQRQLYWECQTCVASEDRYDDTLHDYHDKRELITFAAISYCPPQWLFDAVKGTLHRWRTPETPLHLQMTRRIIATIGSVIPTRAINAMWLELIKASHYIGGEDPVTEFLLISLLPDYTSRELSFGSDKLVAFEAVAKVVARRTNQTYCAGLWSKCLGEALFWSYSDTSRARRCPGRAPSWSWASWDGTIRNYTLISVEKGASSSKAARPTYPTRSLTDRRFRSVCFLNQNPAMQAARGVSPVSLRVGAYHTAAFRSSQSCASYKVPLQHMLDNILLFGTHAMPWDPTRCFLLFIEPTSSKHHTSAFGYCDNCGDKSSNRRHRYEKCERACERCGDVLGDDGEAALLAHLESCSLPESTFSEESAAPNSKLAGLGLFDDPSTAPKTFEILVLWVSDEFPEHDARCKHAAADQPDLSIAKVISKRDWTTRPKKTYFCLLVEATAVNGTYRRIGIGICYWYRRNGRYGGVKLDAKSKQKVTLI